MVRKIGAILLALGPCAYSGERVEGTDEKAGVHYISDDVGDVVEITLEVLASRIQIQASIDYQNSTTRLHSYRDGKPAEVTADDMKRILEMGELLPPPTNRAEETLQNTLALISDGFDSGVRTFNLDTSLRKRSSQSLPWTSQRADIGLPSTAVGRRGGPPGRALHTDGERRPAVKGVIADGAPVFRRLLGQKPDAGGAQGALRASIVGLGRFVYNPCWTTPTLG